MPRLRSREDCIGSDAMAQAGRFPASLAQDRGWVAMLDHARTDLKTDLSYDELEICALLSDWLFSYAVRIRSFMHC